MPIMHDQYRLNAMRMALSQTKKYDEDNEKKIDQKASQPFKSPSNLAQCKIPHKIPHKKSTYNHQKLRKLDEEGLVVVIKY